MYEATTARQHSFNKQIHLVVEHFLLKIYQNTLTILTLLTFRSPIENETSVFSINEKENF